MRYLIIHAERKHQTVYGSEAALLADHAPAGRDSRGFPVLDGFTGPHWYLCGGDRLAGEHLEYRAIHPNQPDALNPTLEET